MSYLCFFYNPNKELYKAFHKLLKLHDCKIYVSRNFYSFFLQNLHELTGSLFICTGILKFLKMNRIVIKSNRVRDGIFYIKEI